MWFERKENNPVIFIQKIFGFYGINMSIDKVTLYASILEALAVGDAMGMPTEFMTQKQIAAAIPEIHGLIDPQKSLIHSELPYASITDDTEQNLYLIEAYLKEGKVTVENSAKALMRWVVECDAVNRKYIGPSSLKALNAIKDGEDPYLAGMEGTTCGAMMRTPALVLCSPLHEKSTVMNNIKFGCIPTHNTSQAIEAAVGYGFALREAMVSRDMDRILEKANYYVDKVIGSMDYVGCAPSCSRRLAKLKKEIPMFSSDEELLEELYYVYGTGLAAIDIFTAVFGIFMYVREDVYKGILLATRLGGDTDTIASLVGALCTAYRKGHNIPEEVVTTVLEKNSLDLNGLAERIVNKFGRRKNG